MHPERVDIPAILRRLPLFHAASPEQIAHIAAATREKRLARGEMLFQKGDPARGFYAVVYGQIKLAFPSEQGNEKVVDIIGQYQTFGEAVVFLERPYPVFADALTDTLLLHISSSAIFDLLERDASFAKRMLAGLSMRLHALIQDVEAYSLRSSTQRVIGYLLQHADSVEHAGAGLEIELPTSKQVIASRLNLTPETFSRILHELIGAGLVSVHGRQVFIPDLKRLREH